jgi:TetR/AcrR family transcriptional regulator
MSEPLNSDTSADGDSSAAARKRPKPGERRLQILQTLALMLQEKGGERVTTAALAGRLQVSEAALYRHFASKAQMFEGLIEFIEQTIFGLINQITAKDADPVRQLRTIIAMLLSFAERNQGMTRVLIGDALVTEDDRLQERINQLLDRVETSLKQCLRNAQANQQLRTEEDVSARANLILSYVLGRWMRFAKSGFKRFPGEGAEQQLPLLI